MATITVVRDDPQTSGFAFRAVNGNRQAVGATVGQALDALGPGGMPNETTLVVLQPMTSDAYFTAEQRDRLANLMAKWRRARDLDQVLDQSEQSEIEELVKAEVTAAGRRAADLIGRLRP